MTIQLMGNGEAAYGKEWLQLVTNPYRTRWHIWRTITCCHILNYNDNNNNKLNINTIHESLPIAFIMYKLCKNGKNSLKSFAELFWILVDNKHRKRGIANRLIDTMIEQCLIEWGITSFRLHVLNDNYNAMKLYSKIGFYKEKIKPNYPQKGYTSYRYRLDL